MWLEKGRIISTFSFKFECSLSSHKENHVGWLTNKSPTTPVNWYLSPCVCQFLKYITEKQNISYENWSLKEIIVTPVGNNLFYVDSFFQLLFGCPIANFGPSLRGSLTHPMLLTVFPHFQPRGHQAGFEVQWESTSLTHVRNCQNHSVRVFSDLLWSFVRLSSSNDNFDTNLLLK